MEIYDKSNGKCVGEFSEFVIEREVVEVRLRRSTKYTVPITKAVAFAVESNERFSSNTACNSPKKLMHAQGFVAMYNSRSK